jgi:predicted negative regulator of RcsB-dependent stress response
MSRQLSRIHEEARLLEQIGDLLYHKGDLREAEENYQTASLLYKKSR